MTGPEHYDAAESAIREAFACKHPEQDWLSDWHLRLAQVHATLALAAATATAGIILELPENSRSAVPWNGVLGTSPHPEAAS